MPIFGQNIWDMGYRGVHGFNLPPDQDGTGFPRVMGYQGYSMVSERDDCNTKSDMS